VLCQLTALLSGDENDASLRRPTAERRRIAKKISYRANDDDDDTASKAAAFNRFEKAMMRTESRTMQESLVECIRRRKTRRYETRRQNVERSRVPRAPMQTAAAGGARQLIVCRPLLGIVERTDSMDVGWIS
jgi:hypothetical protein